MGYIGAVIGAGFASGQEIIQFFVTYGLYGLKGVLFAGLLFGILGGMLLYIAHQNKISNYQNMLVVLWGERIAPIIDFSLAIFLFLGISTMLSASGAIFYEHINLSQGLGVFSAYALTALFLVWGKNGLVTSFNVLVPIKIILIIMITVYAVFFIPSSKIGTYTAFLRPEDIRFWAVSSILYVAYNFALAMVILTEYQTLTDKRGGIAGGIWGGLVLGLLLLLTFLALSKFLPVVLHYEVPMLFVAGNISVTAKHFYTIVLWLGILTTALANTYGFAQRFAEFTGISYRSCLIICLTLALPLAMLDFSELVGKVYPLFGILGLFIVSALIYKFTKEFIRQIYYNIIQR